MKPGVGRRTGANSLPTKPCEDVGFAAYERSMGHYIGLSAGQLRDGLDAFYADYRNRQIIVKGAIQYVAASIAGVPAADLEQAAERMRRAAR